MFGCSSKLLKKNRHSWFTKIIRFSWTYSSLDVGLDKGLVINYEEGATKRRGGRKLNFTPTKKGMRFTHAEGGGVHNKV